MTLLPSHLGLPPKFTSYRPEVKQEELIQSLAVSDKRFSMIIAPAGIGKSLVAISVAKLLRARYLYLVSTKTLGDQIYREFSSCGLYDLKGHNNYPCGKYLKESSLIEAKCTDTKGCAYRKAIEAAFRKDVDTNYAHWLSIGCSEQKDRLGDFGLLILDEAHTAEAAIVSRLSIEIKEYDVRSYLGIRTLDSNNTIQEWAAWAREAAGRCQTKTTNDEETQKRNEKIANLKFDLERLASDSKTMKWIARPSGKGTLLSPVWGSRYAEEYLFRGIERVILMSATLTRSDAGKLGIEEDQFDVYEVESAFNPSRRPFIFIPTKVSDYSKPIRVDNRTSTGELQLVQNTMDVFIGRRLDRKGIVHTVSYDRADMIYSRSRHKNIIMTHDRNNGMETTARFKRMQPPAVLASPRIKEGEDFAFDLCRYVILPKVPFPDSRDPMIQARITEDKDYKNYLAMISILQMIGRGMRDARDWCEIIILDGHWLWFRDAVEFPKWFKRAWRVSYSQPEPLRFAA